MSSWSSAGTSPQSTGVGEESLPAIRAYLHQVIFKYQNSSISVCLEFMQLNGNTCQLYDLQFQSS